MAKIAGSSFETMAQLLVEGAKVISSTFIPRVTSHSHQKTTMHQETIIHHHTTPSRYLFLQETCVQRVTFDKQVSVQEFEVESDWDSECDQEWKDYLQALLDQGMVYLF